MSIIGLMTDFGISDWFVGSMKGVIHGINPSVAIVDITHTINRGDIKSAAFCLYACYKSFPLNSVFITVVDPGVGSRRKSIIAKTDNYLFVGPDNGVFSYVLNDSKEPVVIQIENKKYLNEKISHTFHGRDVFAPVGAYLFLGVQPKEFGSELKTWESFMYPEVKTDKESIIGEVVYIDVFGNAFTNISGKSLSSFKADKRSVQISGKRPIPICDYYSEVSEGKPLALINSADFLEIAVRNGNAAKSIGLSIGTKVQIPYLHYQKGVPGSNVESDRIY